MNTSILPQINTECAAYRFGQADAEAGKPCDPEMVFLARRDQIIYAAGYESISAPTLTTCQFTGSEMPAPIVTPNYKRNDREYTRRTDENVQRIFQMATARDKKLQALADKTAAFMGGIFEGDVIFA